jgi:beta-lactamase superfamily II metal-dependent hydrolase
VPALLLASLLSLALPFVASAAPDRGLEVYWIDVEGGAATLVVTPAGESVLIDAGNPGGRDAERIHKVATETAGLKQIDHLVVTHLHRDHFGGVAELAERMPVGILWENPVDQAPEAERAVPEVEAFRKAKVAQRRVVQPGQDLLLAQSPKAAAVRVAFLAARQQVAGRGESRPNPTRCAELRQKDPDASDNANSVVTLVELGPFRLLDPGDLTWNVEGQLVCPDDLVGPVDVYQTSHHGLDNSNNAVVVKTVEPTVVVFNNGPRKGGEPQTQAAVRALPSVEAIYQVHKNLRDGASNTDAKRIANAGESDGCAGNVVHLRVEPNGEGYRVRVPATSQESRFKTRRR